MKKPNPTDTSLQIVQDAQQIVAKIDKDAFKAMFYLFAGKPDTKHRAFEGKVLLTPADIDDLAAKVASKFTLHGIDTEVVSVSVALQKKKTFEFGTLAEFQRQDWKISEETHEVTVKWDFMINIPSHAVPQRHTLTVRITRSAPSPDGMKVMINEMSQKITISGMGDVCTAKVDFINVQLADELLNLVSDWHSALRRPVNHQGLLCHLESFDRLVANIVKISFPFALMLILYGISWRIFPSSESDEPLSVAAMRDLVGLGLLSVLMFLIANFLGKTAGGKIYEAINSYGGHHPFSFTRGDEAALDRISKLDNSSMKQFGFLVVLPLIINIIAGVLLWKLLPSATAT